MDRWIIRIADHHQRRMLGITIDQTRLGRRGRSLRCRCDSVIHLLGLQDLDIALSEESNVVWEDDSSTCEASVALVPEEQGDAITSTMVVWEEDTSVTFKGRPMIGVEFPPSVPSIGKPIEASPRDRSTFSDSTILTDIKEGAASCHRRELPSATRDGRE